MTERQESEKRKTAIICIELQDSEKISWDAKRIIAATRRGI